MSFLTGADQEKFVKATKNPLTEELEPMTRKLSEILYYLKFADRMNQADNIYVMRYVNRHRSCSCCIFYGRTYKECMFNPINPQKIVGNVAIHTMCKNFKFDGKVYIKN